MEYGRPLAYSTVCCSCFPWCSKLSVFQMHNRLPAIPCGVHRWQLHRDRVGHHDPNAQQTAYANRVDVHVSWSHSQEFPLSTPFTSGVESVAGRSNGTVNMRQLVGRAKMDTKSKWTWRKSCTDNWNCHTPTPPKHFDASWSSTILCSFSITLLIWGLGATDMF